MTISSMAEETYLRSSTLYGQMAFDEDTPGDYDAFAIGDAEWEARDGR